MTLWACFYCLLKSFMLEGNVLLQKMCVCDSLLNKVLLFETRHCMTSVQAVSCAGIGSVEVSELSPHGDYVAHQFKCQSSITYQVSPCDGLVSCTGS